MTTVFPFSSQGSHISQIPSSRDKLNSSRHERRKNWGADPTDLQSLHLSIWVPGWNNLYQKTPLWETMKESWYEKAKGKVNRKWESTHTDRHGNLSGSEEAWHSIPVWKWHFIRRGARPRRLPFRVARMDLNEDTNSNLLKRTRPDKKSKNGKISYSLHLERALWLLSSW